MASITHLKIQEQQLPINELNGTPPWGACPISNLHRFKDILCDFPEHIQDILFEEFEQSVNEIQDIRQELDDTKEELAALKQKYVDSETDKKIIIHSLRRNIEEKQKIITYMNDICKMSQTNASQVLEAKIMAEKIMQSANDALQTYANISFPTKLVRQRCEVFTPEEDKLSKHDCDESTYGSMPSLVDISDESINSSMPSLVDIPDYSALYNLPYSKSKNDINDCDESIITDFTNDIQWFTPLINHNEIYDSNKVSDVQMLPINEPYTFEREDIYQNIQEIKSPIRELNRSVYDTEITFPFYPGYDRTNEFDQLLRFQPDYHL